MKVGVSPLEMCVSKVEVCIKTQFCHCRTSDLRLNVVTNMLFGFTQGSFDSFFPAPRMIHMRTTER